MTSAADVLQMVKDNDAKWVDLRFTDLIGKEMHLTIPAKELSEDTFELGQPFAKATVYRAFKRAAAAIGRPDARFHDLRHSYAVAAIRAGDDIKTVQETLGHATASFTLDVYGHVTAQMQQASADRMDVYIQNITQVKRENKRENDR